MSKLKERAAVKALVIREIGGAPHFLYLEKKQPRLFRSSTRIKADIPGGTVEKGESREQACLREVKEESGVEAEHLRKVSKWKFPRPEKSDMLIGTTHLCRYVAGEAKVRAEEADLLEKPRWRKVTDTTDLPKWIIDDLKAAGY